MNTVATIVAALKEMQPLNITELGKEFFAGKEVGLVIVDEVVGFCSPGAGALAPPVEDPMVEKMVEETNTLAKYFSEKGFPILVLQEAHTADHPEPPYPPHCIVGSGEELLVPKLSWLTDSRRVTIVKKSCINGVIGSINDDGANEAFKWVKFNGLDMVIVVGICTDICVLQFVQAMLSARNRDLVRPLKDVVVYTEGCSTYNLPIEIAATLPVEATPKFGKLENLAHYQDIAHYNGLYLMQMSGAVLADKVEL